MNQNSNNSTHNPPPGDGGEAASAVRVLLVDDSPLLQRLVRDRLGKHRFDVKTIANGSETVPQMIAWSPDVVLLDLELPDGDGMDVLTAIKGRSETHEIPIIVLSASGDTAEKVRAFELGAVDCITKPFDIAELRARVRSAVRTYRLLVMLAQRAHIDGLTGLYNRAHFDSRLQQEVAEAERFDTKLSLILCDLDRFKSINDTFGHPFGDRVLEEFAEILRSGRMSDIACRYGGEEFAVILPRAAAGEAMGVAERYRHAVESVQWDEHPDLCITASFGVADLSAMDEHTTGELVQAADRALYEAKQTGRNKVSGAPRAADSMRRTA